MRRWIMALVALAGFLGATGVSTAAAAAHSLAQPLQSASLVLLTQAPAILALCALAATSGLSARLALGVASALGFGTALFAADMLWRVYADTHLFPLAAPIGGGVLIFSWCALGLGGSWFSLRRLPSDIAETQALNGGDANQH